MIKYNILIEMDEDGFFVSDVPELQVCYTQAKTIDELIKRVKEVIALCENDILFKNKFLE
jgi:predicted RNase H-like HicB family nuclease